MNGCTGELNVQHMSLKIAFIVVLSRPTQDAVVSTNILMSISDMTERLSKNSDQLRKPSQPREYC